MPTPARLAAVAVATMSSLAAGRVAIADDGPPGMCECAVLAPVVATPARGWDGRKLSVGVRVTSLGLRDESAPDAEPASYGGGGLHVRYRFTARWELELALEGLREHREDGMESVAGYDAGAIAVRYHLTPRSRWDWFALVGVGGMTPTYDGEPLEGGELGTFQLGGGVERRFGRVGVAAELRAVGAAPAEHDAGPPARMPVEADPDRRGLSGGQLSVAASYHF
jgi:hypothetical protein